MYQAIRIIDHVAEMVDWDQNSFIDGYYARWDASQQKFVGNAVSIPDHNDLAGLTVGDPHPQYLFLAGRSGGQTAVGPITIQVGNAAHKPLIVKGAASQTANLIEIQNNSATVLSSFSKEGYLGIGDVAGTNSLYVTSTWGSSYSGIAKTAEIWHNQTTGINDFNHARALSVSATANYPTNVIISNALYGISNYVEVLGSSNPNAVTALSNYSYYDSSATINRIYASISEVYSDKGTLGSATAGLFGVVIDSPGTATNAIGVRITNITGATNNYSLYTEGGQALFQTGVAGNKGVLIRGAASQTADLQQWQDSSGNILSRINKDGRLEIGGSGGAVQSVYVQRNWTVSALVQQSYGLVHYQDVAPRLSSGISGEIYGYWTGSSANSFLYSIKGYLGIDGPSAGGVTNSAALRGEVWYGVHTGTSVSGANLAVNKFSGVVSEMNGVKIVMSHTGGTATTVAGVNISNVTGGSNNYSIYSQGGQALFMTGAAGVKGLIIQGASSQTANLIEIQNSSATVLATVDSAGGYTTVAHSAFGNLATVDSNTVLGSTQSAVINVQETITATSGSVRALYAGVNCSPASNSSALFRGGNFEVHVPSSTTVNLTNQLDGVRTYVRHAGTGSVNLLLGVNTTLNLSGSGTVSTAYSNYTLGLHSGSNTFSWLYNDYSEVQATGSGNLGLGISYYASSSHSGSGTISSLSGIYVDGPFGTGPITAYYGIYLDSSYARSNLGTHYSIYSAGGKNLLLAGGSTVVPLTLRGAASQSANILEVQNSSGTPTFYVSLTSSNSYGDPFHFGLRAATTREYRIGAYDAGGAMLFNRSDSDATLSLSVHTTAIRFSTGHPFVLDSGGNNLLLCPSEPGGTGVVQIGRRLTDSTALCGASVEFWTNTSQTLPAIAIKSPGGTSTYASFSPAGVLATSVPTSGNLGVAEFYAPNGSYVNLRVGHSASSYIEIMKGTSDGGYIDVVPTANPLHFRAGTFTFERFATSHVYMVVGGPDGRTVFITPEATTDIGLIVKGAASQSANLQEWQNSSGSYLTGVGADGHVGIMSQPNSSWALYVQNGFAIATFGRTHLQSDTGGNVPLAVSGVGGQVVPEVVIYRVNGQTCNLTEWRSHTDAVLASIAYDGAFNVSGIHIVNTDPDVVPFSIQAAEDQVANLTEWRNSDGDYQSAVLESGFLRIGGATENYATLTNAIVEFKIWSGAITGAVRTDSGGIHLAAGAGADTQMAAVGTYGAAELKVLQGTGVGVGLPWYINPANTFSVGIPSTAVATATSLFSTSATTNKAIVVQGLASQTANLQEWQNSSGTVLAAITSIGTISFTDVAISRHAAGVIQINNGTQDVYRGLILNNLYFSDGDNYIASPASFDFIQYVATYGHRFTASASTGVVECRASGATQIPLVVKGAVSQSANLQEWQNSSGTVLAAITTLGNVTSNSIEYRWIGSKPTNADTAITNSQTFASLGWDNMVATSAGGGVAIGRDCSYTNAYSVAIGASANASSGDQGTIAIGSSVAAGRSSVAVGYNIAVFDQCITLGFTLTPGALRSLMIGSYLPNTTTDGDIYMGACSTNDNPGPNAGNLVLCGVSSTTPRQVAQVKASWITSTDASRKGRLALSAWDTAAREGLRIDTNGTYGIVGIGGTTTTSTQLTVTSPAAGYIGLIVQGAASQTANLQEWQNSSGTVLSRISKDGYHVIGVLNSVSGGSGVCDAYSTANVWAGRFRSYPNTNESYGLTIRAGTSNADSAFYVRNANENAEYFFIRGDGKIAVGNTNPLAQFHVQVATAANLGLIVQGAASQTADLQQWQNSSGTTGARVNATRDFSRPGDTGTLNEQFGALAVAGNRCTAVGYNAVASVSSVSIGYNSSATGSSVAIGDSASAPGSGTAVGQGATAGSTGTAIGGASDNTAGNGVAIGLSSVCGSYGISVGNSASCTFLAVALGASANASFGESIAIGPAAITTAINQLVIGSNAYVVNDGYFGSGVTHATPTNFKLNATGGLGTNITGANFTLASGKGTGNAASGSIIFQTSDVGSTGTTLQTLSTKVTITPTGSMTVVGGLTNADCATTSTNAVRIGVNSYARLILDSSTANIWTISNNAGNFAMIHGSTARAGWNATSGYWYTQADHTIGSDTTPGARLAVLNASAAVIGMIVKGAASQSANLTEWQNSSGTPGARVTAARDFSNPGSVGVYSELFGAGATSAGSYNTVVGNSANGGDNGAAVIIGYNAHAVGQSVVIGYNADNSGGHAIVIGVNSSISNHGTIIGHGTTGVYGDVLIGGVGTTGAGSGGHNYIVGYENDLGSGADFNIALGQFNSLNHRGCIVFGHNHTTTANFQLILGGGTYSYIDEAYIGWGITHATPQPLRLNATGGSGTNIAGNTFTIAGSKATGNAVGGSLLFQTSDATTSGTTLQTLTTKMVILASGNVGIGTVSPTALFEVSQTISGFPIFMKYKTASVVGGTVGLIELAEYSNSDPFRISGGSGRGRLAWYYNNGNGVRALTLYNGVLGAGPCSVINSSHLDTGTDTLGIFYAASLASQDGTGTDAAGTNINISGGAATGSATGGSILFKTSDAGSTGATLQTLSTKMTLAASGNVLINGFGAATKGLIVKGAASQSANLQEWQDSSSNVVANITKDGVILAKGIFETWAWQLSFDGTGMPYAYAGLALHSSTAVGWAAPGNNLGGGANLHLKHVTNKYLSVLSGASADANGGILCGAPAAASVGLIVKGFASQSANLIEMHNSAGTLLTAFDNGGSLRFNGYQVIANAYAITLSIQGGAGTQFLTVYNAGYNVSVDNSAYGSPAAIGLLVKGAVSQTANLQEWQNSSANVLANITSNGTIQSTPSNGIFFQGSNASLEYIRMWTADYRPYMRLYCNWTVSDTLLTADPGFQPFIQAGLGAAYPVGWGAPTGVATLDAMFDAGAGWIPGHVRAQTHAGFKVTTDTTNQNAWRIDTEWVDNTTATRTGRGILGAYYINTLQEGLRIDASATQARLGIGGATLANTRTALYTGIATEKGLVIQGFASQSANLQEWQNSAGNVLCSFKPDNYLYFDSNYAPIGLVGMAFKFGGTDGYASMGFYSGDGNIYFQNPTGGFRFDIGGGNVGLVGAGVNGQYYSLQATCDLRLSAADATKSVKVISQNATQKPFIIQGFASQSANLQEWHNSSSTVLASLAAGGTLTVTAGVRSTLIGDAGFGSNYGAVGVQGTMTTTNYSLLGDGTNLLINRPTGGAIRFRQNNSDEIVIYDTGNVSVGSLADPSVRFWVTANSGSQFCAIFSGAASQSTNLTEWRNSSAATLLAVTKDGKLTNTNHTEQRSFTQTSGDGVYTADIVLPAGATLLNVAILCEAVWNSTTADLEVGDLTDPDGFFTSTDLLTDLAAGETMSISNNMSRNGAYLGTNVQLLYSTSARTVRAVITQTGTGTQGKTHLYAEYVVATVSAAVKV